MPKTLIASALILSAFTAAAAAQPVPPLRGISDVRLVVVVSGDEAVRAHCLTPNLQEALYDAMATSLAGMGLSLAGGRQVVQPNPNARVLAPQTNDAAVPAFVATISITGVQFAQEVGCAFGVLFGLNARITGGRVTATRTEVPENVSLPIWQYDVGGIGVPHEVQNAMRSAVSNGISRFATAWRAANPAAQRPVTAPEPKVPLR